MCYGHGSVRVCCTSDVLCCAQSKGFSGTRWLTRWDKEIDFAANILYYGLTIGLGGYRALWDICSCSKHVVGSQTIGEEYTDIWLHSSRTHRRPNPRLRAALILLPTLPSYLLSRVGSSLSPTSTIGTLLRKLPTVFEVLSEINLAIFYLRGTYYNIAKRLLGIQHVRSPYIQHDRNTQVVYRSQQFQRTPTLDRRPMRSWGYCWLFDSYIEHLGIFVPDLSDLTLQM